MVKDNHFNFHCAGCLSISSSFPSELKGGQVFLGAFASFSQSYSYFSVIPQLYISQRTAKLINTPNNWNPNLIGVEVVFSFLAFFCKKVKDCYLYISERGPPPPLQNLGSSHLWLSWILWLLVPCHLCQHSRLPCLHSDCSDFASAGFCPSLVLWVACLSASSWECNLEERHSHNHLFLDLVGVQCILPAELVLPALAVLVDGLDNLKHCVCLGPFSFSDSRS